MPGRARRIIGIGRKLRGRRKDGTTFPLNLSAGMNDYISKPVNMTALMDMVDKWAPPRA